MADDDKKQHVIIEYTNHRGERGLRLIEPESGECVQFGHTEWHPEEQWLLHAFDLDKRASRTFAMANIHGWHPADSKASRSDETIASQLQAALEREIRMVERLKKLKRVLTAQDERTTAPTDLYVAIDPIDSILKDEEPTWPA